MRRGDASLNVGELIFAKCRAGTKRPAGALCSGTEAAK